MKQLIHRDSLQGAFRTKSPTREQIIEELDAYANDKLAELDWIDDELVVDSINVEGDEVTITFIGNNEYRFAVDVVEWDRSQGVAIPLVELRFL